MKISVVIPAHNEEAVIGRCLAALANGVTSDAIEVVVVPNGCTDGTAAVARTFGATVIETDVPSKSNALNLGDQHASHFPRLYLDADCVITGACVLRLGRQLLDSGKLVASPRMNVDLTDRGYGIRAFYAVWSDSAYVRSNLVGSGAYMLTEAGRARFESFPSITADDAFVRLQFKQDERLLPGEVAFKLTPPSDLQSLIRIKTRAHFGNYELRKQLPPMPDTREVKQWPSLLKQAIRPWRVPQLAVYLYVMLSAKRRAKQRIKAAKPVAWERDDSSRVAGVAA